MFSIVAYSDEGEGAGASADLRLHGLHVAFVDVGVAQDMHELLGLQLADVGDHEREERIRGNVERDAQPHIARPLVHQTRELALLCVHEELTEQVARRKRHLIQR